MWIPFQFHGIPWLPFISICLCYVMLRSCYQIQRGYEMCLDIRREYIG
jgi:hypothetical protein